MGNTSAWVEKGIWVFPDISFHLTGYTTNIYYVVLTVNRCTYAVEGSCCFG